MLCLPPMQACTHSCPLSPLFQRPSSSHREELQWLVACIKVDALEGALNGLAWPTPPLVALHHCACRDRMVRRETWAVGIGWEGVSACITAACMLKLRHKEVLGLGYYANPLTPCACCSCSQAFVPCPMGMACGHVCVLLCMPELHVCLRMQAQCFLGIPHAAA